MASSKEKTMRVEPEPMAAVFFDVEPDEEPVAPATNVKVVKKNAVFLIYGLRLKQRRRR